MALFIRLRFFLSVSLIYKPLQTIFPPYLSLFDWRCLDMYAIDSI